MISAFIICQDEAERIAGCIDRLDFCDQVVVVDSGSRDATAELARQRGADVFHRPWTGYSDQRNHAIEQCRGDWLLYFDADERPGPGLAEEVRSLDSQGSEMAAFEVNSREWFLGAFLAHGGYGLDQPNHKVRLWKRGTVRFDGDIHERAMTIGPVGHLSAHVEHYSRASTLSGLVEQTNRYSDIEAASRLQKGECGSWWRLWSTPLRAFLTRYVRFGGFRDGARGLWVAVLRASYFALIEAKMLSREGIFGQPPLAAPEPAESVAAGDRQPHSDTREVG